MGRQEIKDIRRVELIEAVIDAVHQHGFASLTVSQIAKAAQTSTGSIHYYFGGKEALLEATMRHLLTVLKSVTLRRLEAETDPRRRLTAIVRGNFDAALFTSQSCRVWAQFWAYAPYSPRLAQLQQINKNRVRSNLRAELRRLLPEGAVEPARIAVQAYMDGVWLNAALSADGVDAATAQDDAARFLRALLQGSV